MKLTDSLTFKINLAVLITVLMGFTATGLYFTHRFSAQVDNFLRDQARIPAQLMNQQALPYSAARNRRALSNLVGETVLCAAVMDQKGTIRYSTAPEDEKTSSTCPIRAGCTTGQTQETFTLENGRLHIAAGLFAEGRHLGELHMRIDTTRATAKKRQLALTFFAGSLLSTLLTTLIGITLVPRLILPRIHRAVECLRKTAHGNYAARIPDSGSRDELGVLERGINHTFCRLERRYIEDRQLQQELSRHRFHLEELVAQRTRELDEVNRRLSVWDEAKDQWLNLISHEMRTPLTGLIGTADVLFSALPEDHAFQDLRDGYMQSVNRMHKLIDDAMMLTRVHVDTDLFAKEKIPWKSFLTNLCRQMTDFKFFPAFSFTVTVDPEIHLLADHALLERALSDLLLTAECCVQAHENIILSSQVEGDQLITKITTDGRGLPPEELELFFDIGGQRTLLKGGGDFGLGPALAARIIRLFNGRCSVANGEECGLIIRIELPVART